ncbi:dihydrolipoyl dehydrogenase [Natrinema salifodinae]|uniref:Dihydrolipoamide dehydrogenase n=1 Tax=Natrinema salifodinae TaxID=1202768 RepID=A0A1I0QBF4_9EURY|nr:dihydrolipoyl dehydrogenase [Natrinema salifodinae]SEW24362.1 dihydrolipoamide dehydrogenase [Natrinema salifodinae]
MEEYDIVVIGGGSGSQVATAAAEQGLEAAVVERGPLGGACITRGCVPSKALIHRADVTESVRNAEEFGVTARLEDVDYGGITDAIHDTVYEKADNQESNLRENERISLYRGEGRFVDDRTVEIDLNEDDRGGSATIRGDTVVIAVGSRPMVPPIDGIEDVDFLTSDDALFLDDRPDDLVIVGGGYIGAELGYFFAALGTDVSLVGRSDELVPRADDDVSAVVTESLETHCDVYTGYEAAAVAEADDGVTVTAEPAGGGDEDENGGGDDGADTDTVELTADELLLATGRRPNTDTLDLDATGVETDEKGYVETDDHLETTADGIWALGDIVGEQPFKHAADDEALVVTANVLDDAGEAVDYRAMPHAIFTEPQVASVGVTEDELATDDRDYEAVTVPYDAAPLGLILEAGDGFVKAIAAPDGEILGCHIVGPQASTLLHEVVVAMDGGGTVEDVAEPVHVHPALNEVVYAAFDELSDAKYSTAPDWRDVA